MLSSITCRRETGRRRGRHWPSAPRTWTPTSPSAATTETSCGSGPGFLQGLSAFSVPATYGESFGLYVIEALAAGVPVVQPNHAAFPELIEATGGGVLCEPDDPHALAAALAELLRDPAAARAIGARGR